MGDIHLIQTISDMRALVGNWRSCDERIGFVPTMGALHEGHLSLVELAQERTTKTVVSVYVNPAQFAPHEDFDSYPRPLEADLDKLTELGVDAAYLPSSDEMYPDGFSTKVRVEGLSEGLCSVARPHFFDGVALVVAKLLLQVWPDVAVFGEKDFQQLLIIKRLATDLNLPVQIVGGPIQREPDGLAMSSRNVYLSTDERRVAGNLNAELRTAADLLHAGESVREVLDAAADKLTAHGFSSIDYLEFRDDETLKPLDSNARGGRLLAAVWLGKTRLIDNWPVIGLDLQ